MQILSLKRSKCTIKNFAYKFQFITFKWLHFFLEISLLLFSDADMIDIDLQRLFFLMI